MSAGLFIRSLLAVAALAFTAAAHAHETRPAYLELVEREPHLYDITWKIPASGGEPLAGEDPAHQAASVLDPALTLSPVLSEKWTVIRPLRIEKVPGAEVRRWTIKTGPEGVDGWPLAIHGLSEGTIDALVRVQFVDGTVISQLLRPDSPSFTIQKTRTGMPVMGYLRLGVEHILFGVDHLLFVLGLLLIVRGMGMLVKTITAFTVAHSISLALATFGWVHVPAAPLNAAIALSILFLGPEIIRARRGETSLAIQYPWVVAFAFGLLHGMGFASDLQSLGLPHAEIPAALLFFNVGVELGQLFFVGLIFALVWSWRQLEVRWPRWTLAAPAYTVGSLGAYWTIQRVAMLF